MRLKYAVQAIIVAMVGVPAVVAQGPVNGVVEATRFDVSAGYQYTDANAPPGGCQCFGLNGGYASAGLHLNRWLSGEFRFTGSRASNVSLLGQNLTLYTYLGGPKISYRFHRFVPYGEALFGGAKGSDSYFPTGNTYTTSASSFAYSAGGGIDYNLTPRFALRAIDAQYLHTKFPNGTSNNTQNHLTLAAGIVFKFRGRTHKVDAPPPAEAANRVTDLTCTTKTHDVQAGQLIEVMGKAFTLYPRGDVAYSWNASGGVVQGTGQRVTIDTTNLATGDYVVTGHATLVGDAQSASDCQVGVHVTAQPGPLVIDMPQPPPPPPSHDDTEQAFHANVPDALFDYDKWSIRPDAQQAISRAASYLIAHPNVFVMIGGYSDERGTADYNIALGLKRANAVRDALVTAGVLSDHLQVISYGKGAQVCTAENEACWQQNRRAAFSLRP